MATQKQIFTEAKNGLDRANHTTSGLIGYLRYIFGKLEVASGGSSISVIADGTKTYAQLMNDLYDLVDFAKISKIISIYDEANNRVCPVNSFSSVEVDGSGFRILLSNVTMYCMMLKSNGSTYRTATIATDGALTINTISNTVPEAGKKIVLYYL